LGAEEKPPYLIFAIVIILSLMGYGLWTTGMLTPLLGSQGTYATISAAYSNAQNILRSGGLVGASLLPNAKEVVDIYEACVLERSPLKCASKVRFSGIITNTEILEQLASTEIENNPSRLFLILGQQVKMWEGMSGGDFSYCGSECIHAFYLPFEEGGTMSVLSPIEITKTLSTFKNTIMLYCGGNLNNCPETKNCMECYDLYEKAKEGENRKYVEEMINKGCHESCFIVAREVKKLMDAINSGDYEYIVTHPFQFP